jgi:hypothetical protein
MVNTNGYRRGTRYLFARPFRKNGVIPLSTYMKVYKRGDIVDIKVNISNQKKHAISCHLSINKRMSFNWRVTVFREMVLFKKVCHTSSTMERLAESSTWLLMLSVLPLTNKSGENATLHSSRTYAILLEHQSRYVFSCFKKIETELLRSASMFASNTSSTPTHDWTSWTEVKRTSCLRRRPRRRAFDWARLSLSARYDFAFGS